MLGNLSLRQLHVKALSTVAQRPPSTGAGAATAIRRILIATGGAHDIASAIDTIIVISHLLEFLNCYRLFRSDTRSQGGPPLDFRFAPTAIPAGWALKGLGCFLVAGLSEASAPRAARGELFMNRTPSAKYQAANWTTHFRARKRHLYCKGHFRLTFRTSAGHTTPLAFY